MSEYWGEAGRGRAAREDRGATVVHATGDTCRLSCEAPGCGKEVLPDRVRGSDAVPTFRVPDGWFVSRVGSDPVRTLCPPHVREKLPGDERSPGVVRVPGYPVPGRVLSFADARRQLAGSSGQGRSETPSGRGVEEDLER